MDATDAFVESKQHAQDQTHAFSDAPEKASTARPVAPAKAASGNPEAGETFGDFRLDKKLGEGGMGAVYKAQQISMDRTVALKLLAKNLSGNQAFVDRFKREARTMAKLDHPNIVRGFAVGDVDGQHYVAMEFIDGLSMQKWMDKLGRLPVGDAVHVVLCTAYALQHAHEQSLVHRDIKPDNILMTTKGVVKLADLGLAKKTDDDMSLTQSGTGFGTPYYMPLEQYRDAKHVDARADIYALGVTLYYFLTGKLPFVGDTHFDVIKAKEAAKFTPARKHNPDIPERLDLMIDKMIQKDKKHRYQTCAEVIEALESIGVHSEFPSFVGAPPPAAKGGAATARPSTLPPKSKTDPPPTDDEPAREMWILRQKDPSGKVVKRQVSTGRLKQLLERGEIDAAQCTVQRTTEQNQRPIRSVPEFASLVQSKVVEARADRRSQKLEYAYEKLEREASRRALFKKLSNMFRSAASLVILIIVIAAIAAGGWWLFKNKDTVVQKVQDTTKTGTAPTDTQSVPANQ
jgi:serine/threonine-protein kinase